MRRSSRRSGLKDQQLFSQASFVLDRWQPHAHGTLGDTGQAERFLGADFKACQRTWQRGDGGDDEGRVSDERGERRAHSSSPSASLEGCSRALSPRLTSYVERCLSIYSVKATS